MPSPSARFHHRPSSLSAGVLAVQSRAPATVPLPSSTSTLLPAKPSGDLPVCSKEGVEHTVPPTPDIQTSSPRQRVVLPSPQLTTTATISGSPALQEPHGDEPSELHLSQQDNVAADARRDGSGCVEGGTGGDRMSESGGEEEAAGGNDKQSAQLGLTQDMDASEESEEHADGADFEECQMEVDEGMPGQGAMACSDDETPQQDSASEAEQTDAQTFDTQEHGEAGTDSAAQLNASEPRAVSGGAGDRASGKAPTGIASPRVTRSRAVTASKHRQPQPSAGPQPASQLDSAPTTPTRTSSGVTSGPAAAASSHRVYTFHDWWLRLSDSGLQLEGFYQATGTYGPPTVRTFMLNYLITSHFGCHRLLSSSRSHLAGPTTVSEAAALPVWHSSTIVTRLSGDRVQSRSGSVYCLKGKFQVSYLLSVFSCLTRCPCRIGLHSSVHGVIWVSLRDNGWGLDM